jgi:4-amino-4-deoxy-L-arabinose transferase-like glycosyltransferase
MHQQPSEPTRDRLSAFRALLPLILLAAMGGLALTLATVRWGIGIESDSVVFLSTAHNVLGGRGILAFIDGTTRPLTHFPPLYPLLLTVFANSEMDVVHVARWLNSGLFAANILLIGAIIKHCTPRSRWLPAFGAFLLLTSPDVILTHAIVLTEPLFLLPAFGGLLLFAWARSRGSVAWLLLAALVIGVACLIRYPGVVLIAAAGAELLLFDDRRLRVRLRDAVVFSALASVPLLIWFLRNMLVSGNAANRELLVHPITLSHIQSLIFTISTWLLPQTPYFQLHPGIRILLVGVLLVGGFWFLSRYRAHEQVKRLKHALLASPLLRLLSIFVVLYLLFLVVSISLFDLSTPLNYRLLLPAYVALVILVCALVYHLAQQLAPTHILRRVGVLVGILVIVVYGVSGVQLFTYLAQQGWGYSGKLWHESALLPAVAALPAETQVYTNASDVVYILSGRETASLPYKRGRTNGKARPAAYAAEMEAMRQEVVQQQAVIAYFDLITWRDYLPSKQAVRTQPGVQPVLQTWDGTIYGGDTSDE